MEKRHEMITRMIIMLGIVMGIVILRGALWPHTASAADIFTDGFSSSTPTIDWTYSLSAASCNDNGARPNCSGGLRIEANGITAYAQLQVNLTGYTNASMTFNLTENTLDSGDSATVTVNGTSVATYNSTTATGFKTISLASYTGVINIRWSVTANQNDDRIIIDTLAITGTAATTTTTAAATMTASISSTSIPQWTQATVTVTANGANCEVTGITYAGTGSISTWWYPQTVSNGGSLAGFTVQGDGIGTGTLTVNSSNCGTATISGITITGTGTTTTTAATTTTTAASTTTTTASGTTTTTTASGTTTTTASGTTTTAGADTLLFLLQNESNAANVQSSYWLSECGGEAQGGPGQKTFWLCKPSGFSSCSGTSATLTKGADPDNRLTIPATVNFNTMGTTGCCAEVNFVMNADSLVNAEKSVSVTASATGYTNGSFTINFRDNDLSVDDWGWELDTKPETGGAVNTAITGRIFIKPGPLPYLCNVHFSTLDEDGSTGNAYSTPGSPYYVEPSTCQPSSAGSCLCTQASWNLKFPDNAEEKDYYYPNIPDTIDIVAYSNATNWPEGNCIPVLCVRGDTVRDNPTSFPNCEETAPGAATFFYPTFVLTASFDHLHNFYDSNASAGGGTTDPDTDNFNKIIMVDSNLFPIHTALRGDQEYPNVVMRNWTSGVGVRSPSVNDYMNRSVVALADYIPYTTNIFDDYIDGDVIVEAVGMRSHMQWVYALDPANNNFRRYKFIKVPDYVPNRPVINGTDGEILTAGATQYIDGTKCAACDSDYWYRATYAQAIEDNKGACPSTCWDEGVDKEFLMFAKTQNGNDTMSLDAACANPRAYFFIPIPKDATGNITVNQVFYGFSHDSSSALKFYLNPSSSNAACKKSGDMGTGGANYVVTGNTACGSDPYIADKKCRNRIDVQFTNVPASCTSTAKACDEQYCYMELVIAPCGNHGGWVVEVPSGPDQQDNAFQVSTLANIDPTTWAGMSTAAQQTAIDNRWATIQNYLDVVPPQSYPGYPSFTSLTLSKRTVGFGFASNTSFKTAKYIKFNDPRDIDAYRDYFDVTNKGPAYIFVADSGNSRIQVFMNATGVAGDVGASFPIRPVPVKVTGKGGTGGDAGAAYKTNEVALRLNSGGTYSHGRALDLKGYTTVDGASWASSKIPESRSVNGVDTFIAGGFYYPHSVAVDQDPDTKDVYLFVADTYNHRIQVFRDYSGVSKQPITNKRFDFRYETGWGTYPLQAQPGPFNYRYPKGLDIARFGNNSSYLYVVDSKDYRVMKYLISENAGGGIKAVTPLAGYGRSAAANNFVTNLTSGMGGRHTFANTTAGFLDPQDVATGYSGFFIAKVAGKTNQTVFLNNYMVYVSDPARNDASTTTADLNMRVMQFIDVPGVNSPVSDVWIPWETYTGVTFDSMRLGQSVYGTSAGAYNSTATVGSTGSTNNAGVAGIFTDRPFGVSALQWNTLKPIDIRVVPANSKGNAAADAYVPLEDKLPLNTALRIGVSSRVQRFKAPLDKAIGFWNASTEENSEHIPENLGRWDGLASGRVHIFCYNKGGFFQKHIEVLGPPYNVTLSSTNCATSGGFVKIVVEDMDVKYSARTGTTFYQLQ